MAEATVIEDVWARCREDDHAKCPTLHFGYHEWDAQTTYCCGCFCHEVIDHG